MQALKGTTLAAVLALPSSEAQPTGLVSSPSLPAATGSALMVLMAQAQARYPNQVLVELTQEMYLSEWEAMVHRFGLAMFQAGLSKAISESRFFPDPADIRSNCEAARRAVADRSAASEAIRKHDDAKAQWELDRAEDVAAGRVSAEPIVDKLWAPREILKASRPDPRRPERDEAQDEAARDMNWAKMEQFRAEHGKDGVAA